MAKWPSKTKRCKRHTHSKTNYNKNKPWQKNRLGTVSEKYFIKPMSFDTPDLYIREIFRLLYWFFVYMRTSRRSGVYLSSSRAGSTRHGGFCCYAYSADDKLMFFIIIIIFPQKTGYDISCKFSPIETMSKPVYWKKISQYHLLKILPRVLSVIDLFSLLRLSKTKFYVH